MVARIPNFQSGSSLTLNPNRHDKPGKQIYSDQLSIPRYGPLAIVISELLYYHIEITRK
jgi:hypothetical protein